MQLNLFQWETIETGEGYQNLGRLNFAEARRHFAQALVICPDHQGARRGQEETEFWEEGLAEAERLPPEKALVLLWERITGFTFSDSAYHLALRQSMLRRLLSILSGMNEGDIWFHPPALCRGVLHLQLNENAEAERYLRTLLRQRPDNGLLRRYLGDALWRQGRQDAARSDYAAALLLAPDKVDAETIPVPGLRAIIMEQGLALAPIYGYFAGILPLVELDTEAQTFEAWACEYLRQAELARTQGQHQSMVTARRSLKEHAPEILAEYLEWLERGDK
ncbi:MAG: tetratricopeptide repeat protein [Desulfocapsa sp.]|nr:tetratricopeptide repeat protein [Desulfocapsa sp.]